MINLFFYLLYITIMCAITYMVYFKDKLKARKGLPRTSERALLTLGFIGGAIGALVAMKKHRHKTRHIHFYIVNVFSIALHIVLAVLIFNYYRGFLL